MSLDVTSQVQFGENDGEYLPLTKCVCGKPFEAWNAVLTIYEDMPWECDQCGRRLFFRNSISVHQMTT